MLPITEGRNIVAWSSDMSLLVAGSMQLTVWRWNPERIDDTGEIHYSLLFHEDVLFPITHLALSADGRFIAMTNAGSPFITVPFCSLY